MYRFQKFQKYKDSPLHTKFSNGSGPFHLKTKIHLDNEMPQNQGLTDAHIVVDKFAIHFTIQLPHHQFSLVRAFDGELAIMDHVLELESMKLIKSSWLKKQQYRRW